MQDSKFLCFWYYNRMIKTKEKDKIKCWTQLGRVNVFKIMTEKSDPKNTVRRNSRAINYHHEQNN